MTIHQSRRLIYDFFLRSEINPLYEHLNGLLCQESVGVGDLATLPVSRYEWQKVSGTIKSGENQSTCSSTMYSTRNSTLAALGLNVDLLIVNLANNCLTCHYYCMLWLLMVLQCTWKSENENKGTVVNNCHIDTARLLLCLSKREMKVKF